MFQWLRASTACRLCRGTKFGSQTHIGQAPRSCWVWCYMLESQHFLRLNQKDCCKCGASLSYMVRSSCQAAIAESFSKVVGLTPTSCTWRNAFAPCEAFLCLKEPLSSCDTLPGLPGAVSPTALCEYLTLLH